MELKLKKGDIIAFKPDETDWFNRCIAWLTNSDTCHAAMVYSEDAIVELISSGVCVNPMSISGETPVHVLRLKPEQPSEPLIKAADVYIQSHLNFDFPALAILAGLLLFRKIIPNSNLYPICRKIILAACKELDELIQKVINKNQVGAMVCSQFVYQIFYDCGKDYQINIVNGNIWSNGKSENTISMPDLLSRDTVNYTSNLGDGIGYETVDESMEELSEQLYHALEGAGNLSFSNTNNIIILNNLNKQNNISGPATEFIKKCKDLQKYLNSNMPLEAMFISAGDMLNHAENLELIGTCNLDVTRHNDV